MTDREYVVYRITNTVTGQCYVGVTCMKLRHRWHKHTSEARLGADTLLYRAMREYGTDSFEMTVVRSGVAEAERWIAEREEIARAGSCGGGYNELPGVPQTVTDPGVPACFTAERAPLSAAQRQRLREARLGKRDTPETRDRRIAAQQRRVAAGGNRHSRGVSRGAAFRTQLSVAKGGVGSVEYDGTQYPSIPLAARAAGVTPATFRRWVRHFGTTLPRMLLGCGRRAARIA